MLTNTEIKKTNGRDGGAKTRQGGEASLEFDELCSLRSHRSLSYTTCFKYLLTAVNPQADLQRITHSSHLAAGCDDRTGAEF